MWRKFLNMYDPCAAAAAQIGPVEYNGNQVQAILLGGAARHNLPRSIHGQKLNPPASGFPYFLDRTPTGVSQAYIRAYSIPESPAPWLPQGQPGGRHLGVQF